MEWISGRQQQKSEESVDTSLVLQEKKRLRLEK